MGSSSSKFRKHLLNGDEYAALQVFQSTAELRRNLNPSCSYGDSLHHNTPLHLAAKHAMKPLLRIFLSELSANPNKRNAMNETSLHLACQGNIIRSPSTQERRAACVNLILQWRGPPLENALYERVELDASDKFGNTALHYAAATGLKRCVELLLHYTAPLFIENLNQETACDLAEKNGHDDIAQMLESNMVFSPELNNDVNELDVIIDNFEEKSGLRPQDLQEAKDQLLVETSDMLHVPLFTAEALLRNHEWSRETLLESWMQDPVECCKRSGVCPPSSALPWEGSSATSTVADLRKSCSRLQEEYQTQSLNAHMINAAALPEEVEDVCIICLGNISQIEDPVNIPCGHRFCRCCWTGYLSVKIQEGEAHSILCPAFGCHQLVPIDTIERLVTPEMVRRYLQFDIEAFVESNRSIKWCPFPGCSRAVRLPKMDTPLDMITIPNTKPPPPVSHAVDCGNGHYFCWECLGEAHAPCNCEKWKEWHTKIAQIKPEELRSSYTKTEDAANCLWLVTNSKPCPSCKSPIQKNEGCNHMKCYKCKHDFCWVCLEGWKKHSSSTGGYFRCNRYEAVHKAEERTGMLISEAESRNKEMQELKRFVHFYTRFKNHDNSYKLEAPLLDIAREKMRGMLITVGDHEMMEVETQFLEEAIKELLRARRVLCSSYVYGYYLEDNGYNKTIFEFMQNDLEELTEKLSEMVSRHYLRSPKYRIVQTALQVLRKRQEFITAVSKGLIPPETPPSLRRSRHRRYPGLMGIDPVEDEQLSQAIIASLQDLDPSDPWVKDGQGKHSNLSAIFDWPDCDSDDDNNSNNALTASILGVCSRSSCQRPRARNPRTGEIHKYCSLQCRHLDETSSEVEHSSFEVDYSMDLLIGLEMSRLQMIEDMQNMRRQNRMETVDPQEQTQASGVEEPPKASESTSTDSCCELDQSKEHLSDSASLDSNLPSSPRTFSFFLKTNGDESIEPGPSPNENTDQVPDKTKKELLKEEQEDPPH